MLNSKNSILEGDQEVQIEKKKLNPNIPPKSEICTSKKNFFDQSTMYEDIAPLIVDFQMLISHWSMI